MTVKHNAGPIWSTTFNPDAKPAPQPEIEKITTREESIFLERAFESMTRINNNPNTTHTYEDAHHRVSFNPARPLEDQLQVEIKSPRSGHRERVNMEGWTIRNQPARSGNPRNLPVELRPKNV